jgi:hypothetical protein
MIDEQGFLIGQRCRDPAIGRSATKKLVNFRKNHANAPEIRKVRDESAVGREVTGMRLTQAGVTKLPIIRPPRHSTSLAG